MVAGKFVSEDPEKWKIINNKLYLGWTKETVE
jgi:hypothetical protein